ncbi:hypothetical protein CLCR_07766 [Cladophialophora carrionii]|uniref:Uncharacterized protein n=1 Tax=Cladophialophora carrionii TaxID=86049 RepID=A0A1C1CNA7_9EURO|nr:hypothetical protein CLCR_07766 [Cladophialophora carrionii]
MARFPRPTPEPVPKDAESTDARDDLVVAGARELNQSGFHAPCWCFLKPQVPQSEEVEMPLDVSGTEHRDRDDGVGGEEKPGRHLKTSFRIHQQAPEHDSRPVKRGPLERRIPLALLLPP